jgi:hypothetical protein
MWGQIILSFCHTDQILVPKFSLVRQIWLLKWLAMHFNDDRILTQSLERPWEIPVRPSAEQAVKKCPSNHCRGQVTQPNVMTTQFLHYSQFSTVFTWFYPIFLHLESVQEPRMTEGSAVHICSLMHSKIRKFWKVEPVAISSKLILVFL